MRCCHSPRSLTSVWRSRLDFPRFRRHGLRGTRSAQVARELPGDRVDHSAPFVRKPTGQVLRIEQNGRLTAATTAAKRRLDGRAGDRARELLLGGGVRAVTPYTSVMG